MNAERFLKSIFQELRVWKLVFVKFFKNSPKRLNTKDCLKLPLIYI